jgi:hypothetical protein
MHNLAVLYHCLALDIDATAITRRLTKEETVQGEEYWDLAFKRWKNVLEHEPFWSRLSARIRALDDPRLTTGLARRMRDCLPLALLSINADLAKTFAEAGQMESAKRQIAIMALWDSSGAAAAAEDKKDRKKSGAPKITGGAALTALERSLETIRQRIKTICKTEEAKSDADATQGLEAASGLLDKAVPLLKILDTLLPAGNTTREAAADEVALTALRCEISFGNKTERWKEALDLLEKVKPIAATKGLKTRIQDNIDIVKTNLVYGTCWFCQENPADKNAALEVKMYGDVVRTPTWQGTRVQWRHGSVTVPRCETCKKAHARREGWQAAGATIGLVLGIGSCLGVGADKGGWLLTPLLLGVGAGLGSLIGKISSPPGIRPHTDHKTFPSVQKLIDQGWTFGTGPAQ